MQIDFKLDAFEGPLDLLLVLIEKNKVDIYDIPIAEITDQYMTLVEEMKAENLDTLSDFLVMATTLLDIKARMLLPKEEDESGEEIDPRTELVERLIEYQEYKMMAGELKEQYEDAGGAFYKDESIPDEVKHYKPQPDLEELLGKITLERLQETFTMVMKRREDMIDPIRSEFGDIEKEKVKISDRLAYVFSYGERKKKFSFRSLLETSSSRHEVIVTFLACLELIKIGQVLVSQEVTFGDINMTWNEDCENKITLEELKQYD